MEIILPALLVAFGAFCVWLGVRYFNRREKWAKRMLFWSILTGMALGVYGWAYVALLDPNPHWDKTETVYLSGPAGEGRYIEVPAEGARPVPKYLQFGKAGEAIFAPAHWVDRQLRQTQWAVRPTGEPLP
jgi:hypothetical protein